jgi:MIP family channel proteins
MCPAVSICDIRFDQHYHTEDNHSMSVPLPKRLVAEFLGAFGLTIVPVLFLGSADPTSPTTLLGAAIASGLSLMAMIYAMGHISGGHYNPSVTVGLAVARRFPGKEVAPYLIVQVLGALFAGALSIFFYGHVTGTVTVPAGATIPHAVAGEVLITFLFVLTVIGTATDTRANGAIPGLAIGIVLIAIILADAGISGAGMNVARCLGTNILAGGETLSQSWIYVVGPLIGAVIAGLVYEFIRGGNQFASAGSKE